MSSRLVGSVVASLALLCAACTEPVATPLQVEADIVAQHDVVPTMAYGRLSGGGHIRDGAWDISFAGQIRGIGTEWRYVAWSDSDRWDSYDPDGQWVIQFHNVNRPELAGTTFKSDRILDAFFALKRVPTSRCVSRFGFTVEGTLDGEPGWRVWLVMADAGHKAEAGAHDSIRIVVWSPGTHPDADLKFFDTVNGVTPNATCLGGGKRDLDSGNLKIDISF